ncbi:MAG: DUF3124 domain-containing protein [Maioricimonas sp. JB049]
MPRESDFPDWLLWLLRHPLLTIFVSVAVVLGIPAMLALYLDYRIASLDQRRAALEARDRATSGAVPTELPRDIVAGQTVYVPLYSHVFEGEGRRLDLAATLSIRNTDAKHSLTISAVRYYNTSGELVRDYLERPLRLNPLGSTEFLVPQSDTSGGSGANFIVEWVADEPVLVPIIEAVMVGRIGTGVTSFVRAGQVVDEFRTSDDLAVPDED